MKVFVMGFYCFFVLGILFSLNLKAKLTADDSLAIRKEVTKRLMENFIEEKARMSPDEFFNNKNKNPENIILNEKESDAIESIGKETKISSGPNPESEIHAVINPVDTSNIMVSPIAASGNFHCPVYYTKDFGKTWKTSTFMT